MKRKFSSIVFVLFVFFIAGSLVYGQVADLKIRIKCPGKATAGQDLKQTINVYVTNTGNAAAKNFPVDLIISKNASAPMQYAVYSATFKEDALLLGGREFVAALAPGQTKAVKLYGKNRIPADTPTGMYFLGAIVDAGNKVREINERNNMDFCRIKVKGSVPVTEEPEPCGISFTSMSKNSGYPGDIFVMNGTWGTTQGTKLPCINKGGMNKLIVLTWTNSKLKVRIPAGLLPGGYKVGVYCRHPSQKTYSSTWKDFRILEKVKKIDPPRRTIRPLKPAATLKPAEFKPGLLRPVKLCPDPAAHAINFHIVNRFSTFSGKVRITGVIKNVSTKAFSGGGGMAYLYEGSTLRKTKSFSDLAPGATLSLFFERNWRSSSPNEGEFPPMYKLMIQYDPDILKDNNKNNDDCTLTNNKKERSGMGINDLFR